MKFNKWTLGLAAVGVVSLASAARADEKLSQIQSALSSTTISGYIDTSAQWNFGTGNTYMPPYKFGGSDKADGFNLNVVQLTIAKPLDEADWASGYRADVWMGPDANTLGTQSNLSSSDGGSDFALRQAYVALRMPVGNGIDWKMGVFDTIIGYESLESGNDPNFTRSYGHTIEPQTHTGLLGSYRFNDILSISAGVANTAGPTINGKAWQDSDYKYAESYKTYMASIAVTAPEDWGWAKGSTLYAGVVNGYSDSWNTSITSWYVGATAATPVTGLKVGAAFDYKSVNTPDYDPDNSYSWALAGYASYQVTEKLSLHLRGDYVEDRTESLAYDSSYYYGDYGTRYHPAKIFALTTTVQYDLWKNVISRLEFRWDHSCSGDKIFGGQSGSSESGPEMINATMLVANIIYKF